MKRGIKNNALCALRNDRAYVPVRETDDSDRSNQPTISPTQLIHNLEISSDGIQQESNRFDHLPIPTTCNAFQQHLHLTSQEPTINRNRNLEKKEQRQQISPTINQNQ